MKKGISLIVLVITIIIMIIIAGAVILSLSRSNVIQNANYSTLSSNRANLQEAVNLKYGDIVQANGGTFGTAEDIAELATVVAEENAKDDDWTITLEKPWIEDPQNPGDYIRDESAQATEVTYTAISKTEEVLKTTYNITTLPSWMIPYVAGP